MESARGILTRPARRVITLPTTTLAAIVLAVAGPATAVAPVAQASAHVAAVHTHKHKHHHRRHHRRHHRLHHAHVASQDATQARSASAGATTPNQTQTQTQNQTPNQTPNQTQSQPLVPQPPCVDADTPATQASVADMRLAVECLVNQERTSRGLPPLQDNSKLTTSAQSWTDNMVSTGDFTHGNNFSGRVSAVGYDWQEAGENIATGYETPSDVVQAWMQSPDHCQNIMDPDYVSFGTGVNTAPVGTFATDPSTWTQDFGLTMTQTAPSQNQGPMNGCPYAN